MRSRMLRHSVMHFRHYSYEALLNILIGKFAKGVLRTTIKDILEDETEHVEVEGGTVAAIFRRQHALGKPVSFFTNALYASLMELSGNGNDCDDEITPQVLQRRLRSGLYRMGVEADGPRAPADPRLRALKSATAVQCMLILSARRINARDASAEGQKRRRLSFARVWEEYSSLLVAHPVGVERHGRETMRAAFRQLVGAG